LPVRQRTRMLPYHHQRAQALTQLSGTRFKAIWFSHF
jgi:hypothetical protein